MNKPQSRAGLLITGLFIASGFSGLIYQSIWSHYLGLTLGHAAYSQTLVLAIYMGGMAIGAWIASLFGMRFRNLLLVYGLVELCIGGFGLAFHALFVEYTALSRSFVLPLLSNNSARLYLWVSCALLILPQSLLLGSTFPLIGAGYLRLKPVSATKVLGGLYFANSIGAAAGALVATFVLLPRVGMPGAMITAGCINMLVAVGAILISRTLQPVSSPEGFAQQVAVPSDKHDDALSRFGLVILLAAGITGATSFVYEIVWVRLLNQALGTSLHSFELMLASFIFGLACGGWWIKTRGHKIRKPIVYAGYAQILMGIAGLLSAVAFAHSFKAVAWLVNSHARDATGYLLFNIGSAVIALFVMFPAAFFAGTTLPLFTAALLCRQTSEATVGRVYAANTGGAIAGVLLTVHLFIPWFGLHHSLVLAGALDALLGFCILAWVGDYRGRTNAILIFISLAALIVSLTLGRPRPADQVSGVFNSGKLNAGEDCNVTYLKDGKTATVGVQMEGAPDHLAGFITINGKADGLLSMNIADPERGAELTNISGGAFALALQPKPSKVAVIGWGTGLMVHTLLGSAAVKQLDAIEIEQAMYEGAKAFHARVSRAYDDPRAHVVFDDARTYFATKRTPYNLIVSVPSNIWVTGVPGLFTKQFYALINQHLSADGVFVQWAHLYQINDTLLAGIVTALTCEFDNIDLYLFGDYDLLFVYRRDPAAQIDMGRLQGDALQAELERVGMANAFDFTRKRVAGPELLKAYTRYMKAKAHSDFYPNVALDAPRARYMNQKASILLDTVLSGMPISDLLDGYLPPARVEPAKTLNPDRGLVTLRQTALATIDRLEQRKIPTQLTAAQEAAVKKLIALSANPINTSRDIVLWSSLVATVAKESIARLPPQDLEKSWIHPAWVARGQPTLINDVMSVYAALAQRDAAAMRTRAAVVLEDNERAPVKLATSMREQILVIAMLGAAGQKDKAAIAALETTYGSALGVQKDGLRQVRQLLLAWAQIE